MTTKLKFQNTHDHSLRRYSQRRDGELRPEGVILPGETVELTVDSMNDLRAVLELDADVEITLPLANPQLHAISPRTLALRTSTRNAKKKWDVVTREYLAPRHFANATLPGPARLEISEMPT